MAGGNKVVSRGDGSKQVAYMLQYGMKVKMGFEKEVEDV